jgi:hypothetical protein
MNTSESIILGIVSGLITSVLVYLIVLVFNKIVQPWFQDIIYSGVRIDGQWYTQKTFRNGDTIQDELLELNQHAHKISGTRTLTKRYKANDSIEIKTFKIEGKIRDRYVLLSFDNIDKRKFGIESSLYEITSGGEDLIGSTIWTDVGTNSITHSNETLKRKK